MKVTREPKATDACEQCGDYKVDVQLGNGGPRFCHRCYMRCCSYCWDRATVRVKIMCLRDESDRDLSPWEKYLCATCAEVHHEEIKEKEKL